MIGRTQLFWHLSRRRSLVLVGSGLTLLGVGADYLISGVGLLSAILVVIDVVLLTREWRNVVGESRDLIVVETSFDPVDSLVGIDEGYTCVHEGSSAFLVSPRVDSALRQRSFPLERMTTAFRLPDSVRPFAAKLIGESVRSRAHVFNGRKVRLSSPMRPSDLDSGKHCVVQRTTYFDSLSTNGSFFRQIRNQPGVVVFDGQKLAISNGLLCNFDDWKLSNHIGVSTIAVTSDHRVVLQMQGVRSAEQPGKIVASGSGSLDWKDVTTSTTSLQELVAKGADRELREECGIAKSATSKTSVVGFYRDLQRGGKPEFLCVSSISLRFSELKRSRRERIYVGALSDSLIRTTQHVDLAEDLSRIVQDHKIVISDALRYHIKLLSELVIERDPEVLKTIGTASVS